MEALALEASDILTEKCLQLGLERQSQTLQEHPRGSGGLSELPAALRRRDGGGWGRWRSAADLRTIGRAASPAVEVIIDDDPLAEQTEPNRSMANGR
jgi:hypothetical protein